MKKITLLVMLFGIVLLGACSQNTSSNLDTNTTESNETKNVTLYIFRHGETMLNITDRVQGWSDAILTKEGQENVQDAGENLSHLSFDAAYSSDSGRSVQTAELLLEENQDTAELNVQTDKRLREFNFGSYEGELNDVMIHDVASYHNTTAEEYTKNGINPKEYADTVALLDKERMKDTKENWPAENYEEITSRLKKAIDEIANEAIEKGNEKVLVVTHGLSIRALVDTLFNELDTTIGMENASVTTIQYDGENFELGTVNNVEYTNIE
ncbi:histidine phosphatase family protein [Tetragenococcus halophilus]